MPLARPQFIVLDSATLGKASHDFWSSNSVLRDKARTFVTRLQDRGVYITITTTHVLELLGHGNDSVARNRLKFLQELPLIAWIRPYNRNWFPGSFLDLLLRELHAVVHDAKSGWRSIVEHVRTDLWETGLGSEMFVDDDRLWSAVRKEAQRQVPSGQYVASISRTDPGNINTLTIGEVKQLPKRPKAKRDAFMRRFVETMNVQLQQHGDRRLNDSENVARTFTDGVIRDIDLAEAAGGDAIEQMLEYRGIPQDLVTDDMTVGDVGQLAVYIEQLKIITPELRPRAVVTVHDIPLETLPSYVLEHRLVTTQRKAIRVSGSDLGDGNIAPLVLYADGVEVDRRTHEYLKQVRRACPAIAGLMGQFFSSADYAEIPDQCGV